MIIVLCLFLAAAFFMIGYLFWRLEVLAEYSGSIELRCIRDRSYFDNEVSSADRRLRVLEEKKQ